MRREFLVMPILISLRSFVVRRIKRALHRMGLAIIRNAYGVDAFTDIKRLSQAWQYTIEVFFDVGAHGGDTTIRARHNFVNCRIIAFEPHPKTFRQLSENTTKIPNVELFNLALGSASGEKTMFEYNESKTNSLLPNAQFAVRFREKNVIGQIQVDCLTLDEFCSESSIRKIDVLKIDTEGFDLEVLKGATSMLAQRAIKFIYFEFNDIAPRSGTSGGALIPIDQLIRAYGYRFIATYNEYVIPEGEPFLVSNALYALPPSRR
jgi:FkbM family methyltransferase